MTIPKLIDLFIVGAAMQRLDTSRAVGSMWLRHLLLRTPVAGKISYSAQHNGVLTW